MKITPLDIKKQEFETKFRGFEKTEVISFLEMISEEMENLLRENMELKEKLQRESDKLVSYTKIESALQSTLVATQESTEQMKAAAQEKADLVIREANIKADKIVESNYEKIAELRREFSEMRNQRAAFLVNFRSLLESQLKLLEMIEKQSTTTKKTIVMKKKAEMSDKDVDKVVEEFERDHSANSDDKTTINSRLAEHEQTQSTEDN